ncbi:pH-response regulator protein palH/prr-4 [Cytospora mali]|uniref:PH-response regulator protein palH/prr-4 n=1 Tax=Cytospora mali TaxID=578113 RepID=A0A194VN89_CYTMA|nr:pH-response regulator protein palH/prr-4 [Valsa mali]
MALRQLIVSDPSPATGISTSPCDAIYLPAGGIINIPGLDPITLTADTAFRPECTQAAALPVIANRGVIMEGASRSEVTKIGYSDFRDPFYASTFPQCYALSATTVIAYTLAIMLFITPRSFVEGGVVVLGRQGFTSGGTGGTNIGGRPWLQKVAATFVAVSLTIATVDTFRVAEQQYSEGIQNAEVLQQDVLEGTELKVIRIISEAFLWLAQAQTLIRLFPRQREKVIIKWTAFALIGLGVIFDSLNSFMYTNQGSLRPRSFTDAIPALSYLFQLSLGVLYAAWVVYYSMMKKHYAYYHPQMRNMCLVALLSVSAVLVPIVFFILDIIKPDFTGWGDYVRWVGGAAASVIVWEWVERIEALEREEKKDGILGREVFDGDEMIDLSASDFSWPRKRRNTKRDDGDNADGGEGGEGGELRPHSTPPPVPKHNQWPIVSSIATRYRQKSSSRPTNDSGNNGPGGRASNIRFLQPPLWPARPPPVATPVSRTDTGSADSTVYAVRYHPMSDTSGTNTEPLPGTHSTPLPPVVPEIQEPSIKNSSEGHHENRIEDADRASAITAEPSVTPSQSASQVADRTNQLGSQSANPPASQSASRSSNYRMRAFGQASQLFRETSKPNVPADNAHKASDSRSQGSGSDRRNLKSRFEEFAVSKAERLRDRMRAEVDTESLPVRVIPAPPRRGAGMQQLRDEEAQTQRATTTRTTCTATRDYRTAPSVA